MRKALLLSLIAAITIASAIAQTDNIGPSLITKATHFRKTPPLREMTIILPGERDRSWKDGIIRNEVMEDMYVTDNALPAGPDPVAQRFDGLTSHRGPGVNIDGVSNVNGVYPPDTDGDVGPNHYFQMINLSFAIWDKEGINCMDRLTTAHYGMGLLAPGQGLMMATPYFYTIVKLIDGWPVSLPSIPAMVLIGN